MRRRIVARMLPADIPQTDHLLELVEMRGIPSITISLPSSPVPADHERIRLQLRDLIDDADRQAKETSVGRPEREAAIARLRSVLDDDDFWTHQSRSLVLLAFLCGPTLNHPAMLHVNVTQPGIRITGLHISTPSNTRR